ncbi:uncharacterized protein BX664DRAFT_336587, partial [Halteromyces radiatus]|uniref:uncharacterized protein n=1 Tax=Halteromyces radiatus TaxID=101107 RepID=UPI0022202D63
MSIFHPQDIMTIPSMEEDDSCSEADTELSTPIYQRSPWFSSPSLHPSRSTIVRKHKSAELFYDRSVHYQTVIRRMSQQIDDFLQSRPSLRVKGPDETLIEMIHQFRATLPSNEQQVCDAMLAWLPSETKRKNQCLISDQHHITQLRQALEKEQQAKQEVEETLDIVRAEMEIMMEEHQQYKDWKQKVAQAERRAAEYDLKLVVLESQHKKEKEENEALIKALQRDVVEKTQALARWDKQWQRQQQQWQQQQQSTDLAHRADQTAWQQEWKDNCQKQVDLISLRLSRESRQLELQLADMLMDNERLEQSIDQYKQQWHRIDQAAKDREHTWIARQTAWERAEKDAKTTIFDLEQKVIHLEAEVLRLYGKNITLANQLGEC